MTKGILRGDIVLLIGFFIISVCSHYIVNSFTPPRPDPFTGTEGKLLSIEIDKVRKDHRFMLKIICKDNNACDEFQRDQDGNIVQIE